MDRPPQGRGRYRHHQGQDHRFEVARTHDLTVGEVEQWKADFIDMGTEALRSHPRDTEAGHNAKEKDLLAKIGDLTMQMEAYRIACELQGKSHTGASS